LSHKTFKTKLHLKINSTSSTNTASRHFSN